MRPGAQRVIERAFQTASAVLAAPERRALQIAREIYTVAAEMARETGDPLPLELRAPLTYLGQKAVPGILPGAQLPSDPDTAADIVAYLTEGWANMFIGFDREHFDKWKAARDGAMEKLDDAAQ